MQLDGGRGEDVTFVPPLEPFRVQIGISDVNYSRSSGSALLQHIDARSSIQGPRGDLSREEDFQFDFTCHLGITLQEIVRR